MPAEPDPRPWLAYGVLGDGLGHAARALVLMPLLLPHYRIVVFSAAGALDLLQQHFGDCSDVRFEALPITPLLVYRHRRIALLRTTARFLFQCAGPIPAAARRLRSLLVELDVVAVISDFEPVITRAARLAGRPVLMLSHQHALVAFPPRALGLQPLQALVLRLFYARLMAPHADAQALTSFFQPPLRHAYAGTLLVGGVLRPPLFDPQLAAASTGRALIYLRRYVAYRPVLELIAQQGLAAEVFGLPPQAAAGLPDLLEQPRDPERFVALLAAAPFVIASSGHQLLCEALQLRKPVLALYEPHHAEQRLNALMWQQHGYGLAVALPQLQARHLHLFLEQLPRYRQALAQRPSAQGNATLLASWFHQRIQALSG